MGDRAGGQRSDPATDGLSKALRDDLMAQRTAAFRAALAADSAVALVALAHALALPLFYLGRRRKPASISGP